MHFTKMGFFKLSFLAVLVCVFESMMVDVASADKPFDDMYVVRYGGDDHVRVLNDRRDVQLWMDQSSGGGFISKLSYGSGFFHMRIKLHDKDSAGVATTFYLTSDSGNHDEVDFEFLGNQEGKPIIVQTNLFANGIGNREQQITLWFDPSADFHNYKILWNPHQIVFYVDDIPIRVFKNKTDIGVDYPIQPMKVLATIWNAENWATDGGRTKIDWSHAPFIAHYQGFEFGGCPLPSSNNAEDCYDDSKYWWNGSKYWKLSNKEQGQLQQVRQKYMVYDYCSDKQRYPTTPPECAFNI